MTVSVVVPCFNEAEYIGKVLHEVLGQPMVSEVICVNDGSTDEGGEIARLMSLAPETGNRLKYIELPLNLGKGAALTAGIQKAKGDIVIFQDADLEYSPSEFNQVLDPILQGRADVVYGSRFLGGSSRRVLYFWHMVANRILTLLSNMTTNLNLTDIETGSKAIRREFLQKLSLQEKRFGIEPEITVKLSRQGARFYEVPISYHGRSYGEGKKITWRDALTAIYCIFKYAFYFPHQESKNFSRIPP